MNMAYSHQHDAHPANISQWERKDPEKFTKTELLETASISN